MLYYVKAIYRLISKANIVCSIDDDTFSGRNDKKIVLFSKSVRSTKYRAKNSFINTICKMYTHKNKQRLAYIVPYLTHVWRTKLLIVVTSRNILKKLCKSLQI